MTVDGKTYSFVRGSDVNRNGMFLELSVDDGAPDRPLMEIFYSDESGKMTLSAFGNDVPLLVVEWLISQAKELLPPIAERKG